MLTYGSVCSGIEAVTVAWGDLPTKPLWFSEIEKFPCQLLQHHYPDVLNVGDMLNIKDLLKLGAIPKPDVLVGGTPCQAFSIAGMRKGLADERGQLTMTFVEIADEIKPKFILWENVPGVLSDKDNAFGNFIAALAGESEELLPTGKRWSNAGCVFGPERVVAWRVLDAQYFGVAQRRRRVFVVACPRDGADPTKILFEPESLCRNSPPSRSERKETTRDARNFLASGREVTGTILANSGDKQWLGNQEAFTGDFHIVQGFASSSFSQYRRVEGDGGTLKASGGDLAGGSENLIVSSFNHQAGGNTDSKLGMRHNLANTLTCNQTQAVCIAGNIIDRQPQHGGNHIGTSEEISYTLTTADRHAVCIQYKVRRLLPIECERLQGFPDNYTNIPNSSDSVRYKALGNSMAVPVMKWLGERILNVN